MRHGLIVGSSLLFFCLSGCDGSPGFRQDQQANTGSTLSSAQSDVGKTPARSLASVIASAKREALELADAESKRDGSDWRYHELWSDTKRGDFDGDGSADVVSLLTICEKISCHPTSNQSQAVFIRAEAGGFRPAYRIDLGQDPKVSSIRRGQVILTGNQYGPNDPTCCAQEKHTYTVQVRDARFIMSEAVRPSPYVDDADFMESESSGDNRPTEKSKCVQTDFGCLYDTGWKPTLPNTALGPLTDDDVPGGAGCAGSDNRGKMVVGWDTGGSLAFRTGGKLQRASPQDNRDGGPRRFGSDEWVVEIDYGAEIGVLEEQVGKKATLRFRGSNGQDFSVETAMWCGA